MGLVLNEKYSWKVLHNFSYEGFYVTMKKYDITKELNMLKCNYLEYLYQPIYCH